MNTKLQPMIRTGLLPALLFAGLTVAPAAGAADNLERKVDVLTGEVRELRQEIGRLARDYYAYGELLTRIQMQRDVVGDRVRNLKTLTESIKAGQTELANLRRQLADILADGSVATSDERRDRIQAEEATVAKEEKSLQQLISAAAQEEILLGNEQADLDRLVSSLNRFRR
ncbi:MAG: hypothetical protein FDZ69_10215 [Deltaproteobacteria bacterium]|nr:MAG: hypothetical protein FDZ69_10215 [Deltaproteobacteria bacterium]